MVGEEEVPAGANVMGARMLVTIKGIDTNQPICKARFVVQGFNDPEKRYVVHDAKKPSDEID